MKIKNIIPTNSIAHIAFVTDYEETYYSKAGTGTEKVGSYVFDDLVTGKRTTLPLDQPVMEAYSYHGIWVTDPYINRLDEWCGAKMGNIEKNNNEFIKKTDSIKSAIGCLLDNKDTLIAAKDYFCDLDELTAFLELSDTLELESPIHSKDQINDLDIDIVRKKWLDEITGAYNIAIKTLDEEYNLAVLDQDQEAVEEIEMVKELLKENIDEVDFSSFSTPMEVVSFWPQLLLPAPEYTKYITA